MLNMQRQIALLQGNSSRRKKIKFLIQADILFQKFYLQNFRTSDAVSYSHLIFTVLKAYVKTI